MKTRELEEALIGAVLAAKDPARFMNASGLTPDDFSEASLAACWGLVLRQLEHSRPVNAVTLFAAGMAANALADDAVGWLQSLQLRNTLDFAAFVALADDVRNTARARVVANQLRALSDGIRSKGLAPGHISASLEELQQLLRRSYAQNATAELDVAELFSEWDRRLASGKPFRVPTHVPILDEHLGGWDPNLNLILGAPGSLKSGFMATVIEAQLKAGMRVGLFGLEDGTAWLSRRLMAKRLGIPLRDIGNRPLSPEEQALAREAKPELQALLKNLKAYKLSGITTAELCRWSSAWILNEGVECVYVDNATELNYGSTGGRDDVLRVAVAEAFRRVRDLAVRLETPVVVLAHTKREFDDRGVEAPPRPSDAAESAALERRARKMLGTWRKRGAFRVSVIKATEGESSLTFEFDQLRKQALLLPDTGRLVNLQTEAQHERQRAEERQDEKAVAKSERRKRLSAQLKADTEAKAAPVPPPPPQASLFPEVQS